MELEVNDPLHPKEFVFQLDQSAWVRLSQGRESKKGPFWDLFQTLEELSSGGKVSLPLTAGNYLELWHRKDDHSRMQVAATMRDLSRYKTIRASRKCRLPSYQWQ